MGVFSFQKNPGKKLLQEGPSAPAQAAGAGAAPASTPSKIDRIIEYINRQGLQYKNLTVSYDGKETVTVEGVAPDQTTREKIILCCGNVEGVAKVDDKMSVAFPRRSDERRKPRRPRRAPQDRRSAAASTETRRIHGDRRCESTGTRFSRIWYAIIDRRGPVDRRGARILIVTNTRS